MILNLSNIKTIVRGIIIDQVREGEDIDPIISDDEILTSVNIMKDDFFGVRPEAFSVSVVVTVPPTDLLYDRASLGFTYGNTSVVFPNMAASLGAAYLPEGKIELEFLAERDGMLFYSGNSTNTYISAYILPTGFLELNIREGGALKTVTVPVNHIGSSWHSMTIDQRANLLTVTVDDVVTAPLSTTMNLIPDITNVYLGYGWQPDTTEHNFAGKLTNFIITDVLNITRASFAFDSTSGTTAVDSVGGNDGTVYGTSIDWFAESSLAINPWATRIFCYGVASFLLSQRGKDSYFRKAAEDTRKIYMGG